MSVYDPIARLYDAWSRSVVEDVSFYVEEARAAGGPIVELGVGTGRVAIPIAQAGVRVIGVDSSAGMLDVCRLRAEQAGVAELLDLRVGDLARPPVTERVSLVTSPFRAFLHLDTDEGRLGALAAVRELLLPAGRFVFDVFTPSAEDIAATNGVGLEREPDIWECAEWDEERSVLTLSVRGESGETTMRLAWIQPERWRALLDQAGFEVLECYGWFDRTPYAGGEDTIWIARRRD